jgi:hypothetical protein
MTRIQAAIGAVVLAAAIPLSLAAVVNSTNDQPVALALAAASSASLDKSTYGPGDSPVLTVVLPPAPVTTGAPTTSSQTITGKDQAGNDATVKVDTTRPGAVTTGPQPTVSSVADNHGGIWSGSGTTRTRSALDGSDVGTLNVTVTFSDGTTATASAAVQAAATTPPTITTPPVTTSPPTTTTSPSPSQTYPASGTWVKPGLVGADASKVTTTRSSLGSPNSADGQWYENIKFTSKLTVTNQKFRNDIFEQTGSSTTVGGSAYVVASGAAVFQDSTFRITGGLNPTGGPAAGKGLDKGIQATRGGMTVLRNDVSGANIQVYFETQPGEGNTVVQDNYLHDTWSASGDHTDIINGNFEASNVVARGNLMDGKRTGGSKVTNGFGIYDDIDGWENWTVDHNDLTNAATGLLCTDDTSRARNPFVVTNNIWRGVNFVGRSPSVQGGNVDGSGRPLTF